MSQVSRNDPLASASAEMMTQRPLPLVGCSDNACTRRSGTDAACMDQDRRSRPKRKSHSKRTPVQVPAKSQFFFLSKQRAVTGPQRFGASSVLSSRIEPTSRTRILDKEVPQSKWESVSVQVSGTVCHCSAISAHLALDGL